MSKDLATKLFETLKRPLKEIGAELARQGRQGANELAAGLFSGSNAFVQYGSGQYVKEQKEEQKEPEPGVQNEHTIER